MGLFTSLPGTNNDKGNYSKEQEWKPCADMISNPIGQIALE